MDVNKGHSLAWSRRTACNSCGFEESRCGKKVKGKQEVKSEKERRREEGLGRGGKKRIDENHMDTVLSVHTPYDR